MNVFWESAFTLIQFRNWAVLWDFTFDPIKDLIDCSYYSYNQSLNSCCMLVGVKNVAI